MGNKLNDQMVWLTENKSLVEEVLASGAGIRDAMHELDVGRGAWDRWLGTPTGASVLAAARKVKAERLADETLEIADNAEEDRDAIGKAKLRIGARQWLASAWARDTYGKDKEQATINVEHLHLGALQHAPERDVTPEPKAIDSDDDWLA